MIVTEAMVTAGLRAWDSSSNLVEGADRRAMEAAITDALEASPGWLTKDELAAIRSQLVVVPTDEVLQTAVAKIDELLR